MRGAAVTVNGPVQGEDLGVVITHEHLLIDLRDVYGRRPSRESEAWRADEKVTIENLGWVEFYWTSNSDNLILDDENLAVSEIGEYKKAGGGTVVDCTSNGIGRRPQSLAQISEATGVNVIMGSGYYIADSHPDGFANRSVDEIAEEIVRDIRVGIDGVRAGLIGEIGCSWPWDESEKLSLEAAILAQQDTGAPLMIHPGRNEAAPVELLDFVSRMGGDPKRTIVAHVERTIFSDSALRDLADTGVYLEYDFFGYNSTYYPLAPDSHMPGDFDRIRQIEFLLEHGYGEQILCSHDIASKHRLKAYGGHGFHHLLTRIVPWMQERGLTSEDMQRILVANPRRVLTFDSGT